jgi:hypothetical protein
MSAKGIESVGLKGAKTIGDKRVSSLLHFSWTARHDSSPKGAPVTPAPKTERNWAHEEPAEPALPKQRRGTEGRG